MTASVAVAAKVLQQKYWLSQLGSISSHSSITAALDVQLNIQHQ